MQVILRVQCQSNVTQFNIVMVSTIVSAMLEAGRRDKRFPSVSTGEGMQQGEKVRPGKTKSR